MITMINQILFLQEILLILIPSIPFNKGEDCNTKFYLRTLNFIFTGKIIFLQRGAGKICLYTSAGKFYFIRKQQIFSSGKFLLI